MLVKFFCLLLLLSSLQASDRRHRRAEIVKTHSESVEVCELPEDGPAFVKRVMSKLTTREFRPEVLEGSIPLINDMDAKALARSVDKEHIWYLQVRSLFETPTIPTPDDGLCGWHALSRMLLPAPSTPTQWTGRAFLGAFLDVVEKYPHLTMPPCSGYDKRYVVRMLRYFLGGGEKFQLWLSDEHLDMLALVMRCRIIVVTAPTPEDADSTHYSQYPSDVELGENIDSTTWPTIRLLNFRPMHFEAFAPSDTLIPTLIPSDRRQEGWDAVLEGWRSAKRSSGFVLRGRAATEACGSDYETKCAHGLLCCMQQPVDVPQEQTGAIYVVTPTCQAECVAPSASVLSGNWGPDDFDDNTNNEPCSRKNKHICNGCCCNAGFMSVCLSVPECSNFGGHCI